MSLYQKCPHCGYDLCWMDRNFYDECPMCGKEYQAKSDLEISQEEENEMIAEQDEYIRAGILPELSDSDLSLIHQIVEGTVNESTARAHAISAIQEDWMKEHRETQGKHFALTGPGTSSWDNCVLCNPLIPPLTEQQKEDLRDEIEMDLL